MYVGFPGENLERGFFLVLEGLRLISVVKVNLSKVRGVLVTEGDSEGDSERMVLKPS